MSILCCGTTTMNISVLLVLKVDYICKTSISTMFQRCAARHCCSNTQQILMIQRRYNVFKHRNSRNVRTLNHQNLQQQQQKRDFGKVPHGKAVIRYKDPLDDGYDSDIEKNNDRTRTKSKMQQKRPNQHVRRDPFHKWIPKKMEEPTFGMEPDNFRIDIDKRDEKKLGGGRTVKHSRDRYATYEELEAHTKQQMIRGRFDHNIAREQLWDKDVLPPQKLRTIKKVSTNKIHNNENSDHDDGERDSKQDEDFQNKKSWIVRDHSRPRQNTPSLSSTLANKMRLQQQQENSENMSFESSSQFYRIQATQQQQDVPRPVIIKPHENMIGSEDENSDGEEEEEEEDGFGDEDYGNEEDEDNEDEDEDDLYSSTNPGDYSRFYQDPSLIDDLPNLPIDHPYWNHKEPLDYTPLLPMMTKEKSADQIAQEEEERQQRYDAIIQLHKEGKVDQWKRVEVFAAAAYNGDVDLILWLYKNDCPWDSTVCTAAAAGNQLDVIQWLRTYNCNWDTNTTNAAATLDSTEMIRWIRENGGEWDEETTATAACNPDEEMLKYVYGNGCPWDERVCLYAALNGHLQHLQFAYRRNCLWDDSVCTHAAKNGHLHIIQWARANDCPWEINEICAYAALFGHLHVIEWVYNNSNDLCALEWDAKACDGAAYSGRLHILQWLRSRDCPWDETVCASAALKGHWILLQWSHANGCPWDAETCANIARNAPNQKNTPLQMLQWARDEGCDWDERTCANAALNGNLDMLQYAFNQGCLWDSTTCSNAALNGHLHVLLWAHRNGCPWDSTTCANAAAGGHLHILQYLRKESCPWDASTCSEAALNGHQNILEWLHSNGCEWDETSCANAALNGHFELLKWLRQHNCPWDEATCSNAAKYGHFDILQWVRRGATVVRGPVNKADAILPDDENDETIWNLGFRLTVEEEKAEQEREKKRDELDKMKKEEKAYYNTKQKGKYDSDNDDDEEDSSPIDSIDFWDGISPLPDDDSDEVFIEEEYRNLEPRPLPSMLGPVKAIIIENESECCPWDESVCTNAAMTGNFSLLEWAHNNGCPWDYKVLVHAARNRDYNILHYALMMGCQWGNVTMEDYKNPSKSKILSEMNLCRFSGNPSNPYNYIKM